MRSVIIALCLLIAMIGVVSSISRSYEKSSPGLGSATQQMITNTQDMATR